MILNPHKQRYMERRSELALKTDMLCMYVFNVLGTEWIRLKRYNQIMESLFVQFRNVTNF